MPVRKRPVQAIDPPAALRMARRQLRLSRYVSDIPQYAYRTPIKSNHATKYTARVDIRPGLWVRLVYDFEEGDVLIGGEGGVDDD